VNVKVPPEVAVTGTARPGATTERPPALGRDWVVSDWPCQRVVVVEVCWLASTDKTAVVLTAAAPDSCNAFTTADGRRTVIRTPVA
jgi:hypothetical protein